VVCSDIHGYKGVVRRGREGLLVPPRNPKALAAAILQLFSDPELGARMGAAGRERAESYSWERVTAKVEEYYSFVIRRLASQGALPRGYGAPVPPSPRPPAGSGAAGAPGVAGAAVAGAAVAGAAGVAGSGEEIASGP
jgi:hypothetical protein